MHTPRGSPTPDEVVCRGASVIVNPFGEALAGPLVDEEGLPVADLDLDDVIRGRFDFDASGHYRRSDLFTLIVDTTERHPISWSTETIEELGRLAP